MPKLSANLPGVHDIRSLETLGGRSISYSAKSVYLALFVQQKIKERFLVEKERIERRQKQINKRLAEIEEQIARFLEIAQSEAKNNPGPKFREKTGKRTVISY